MYRILDEPRPSPWNHLVVQPLWPLFGIMLGGAWLAFPWFAFNGFALGSHDKWKTLGLALAGFSGAFVLWLGIVSLAASGTLPEAGIPYAALSIVVWKLGVGYYLYFVQSRTFDIYHHFGGPVKNGLLLVVLASFFLRAKVLGALDNALWFMVMS